MGYLTDFQIMFELQHCIEPFEPNNLNPASIDFRLSNLWVDLLSENQEIFESEHVILYPNDVFTGLYNLIAYSWLGKFLKLKPRMTLILATTLERIELPNYMTAQIQLKTTPCRLGLGHPIAGWVDPGYHGKLTLMLHSYKRIELTSGVRICQLVFSKLDTDVAKSYNETGHYQGMITPAKAWTNVLKKT